MDRLYVINGLHPWHVVRIYDRWFHCRYHGKVSIMRLWTNEISRSICADVEKMAFCTRTTRAPVKLMWYMSKIYVYRECFVVTTVFCQTLHICISTHHLTAFISQYTRGRLQSRDIRIWCYILWPNILNVMTVLTENRTQFFYLTLLKSILYNEIWHMLQRVYAYTFKTFNQLD